VELVAENGGRLGYMAVMPDEDGLRRLARWVEERHRQPVRPAIESMTGRPLRNAPAQRSVARNRRPVALAEHNGCLRYLNPLAYRYGVYSHHL
jgi:hypothetical protein